MVTAAVGETLAEALDALERRQYSEDAEILGVLVYVCVKDGEDTFSRIYSDRSHYFEQLGLAHCALSVVKAGK